MEILQKMGPLPVQNWGVLFDTSSEPISFRPFADPFGIHGAGIFTYILS